MTHDGEYDAARACQEHRRLGLFRLRRGVPGDNVGLPPAQLAVLPGTTHITLVNRANWLVSMITQFLDAPVPAR